MKGIRFSYYADCYENKYYIVKTDNNEYESRQQITMDEYKKGMLLINETLKKYE